MSLSEVVIRLLIVAILAIFLLARAWPRIRRRLIELPSDWNGASIDATLLQSRIQLLKEDYVAARRHDSHEIGYRRDLMAKARKALQHLPFFRDNIAEHEHATRAG